MCWSQPLVDGCDEDGRLVADRELVVASCHRTVPFKAIDAALDRVPSLVVLGVERGWPAAARAELLAVASLVDLVRDGAADTAATQGGAVLAGGVGLMGHEGRQVSPVPRLSLCARAGAGADLHGAGRAFEYARTAES